MSVPRRTPPSRYTSILPRTAATTEDRCVGREAERLVARLDGAGDEFLRHGAVPVDVQLKPPWSVGRRGDFFQGFRRDRARNEDRFRGGGAPGGRDLTLGMDEGVKRRGSHANRHRHALSEEDGLRVALRDVPQDAGPQRPSPERFAVPSKGDSVLGSSRNVIEDRTRDLRPRHVLQFEEIRELEGHADANGPPPLALCPGLSIVRRVLRLFSLLVLSPDRHLVEEGREAVHVLQEVRVERVPLREADHSALGASRHGTRPVESRERFGAPREDELRDLADIEHLDRVLEPRHADSRNLRDPRPLRRMADRKLRADCEEVVLNLRQQVSDSPFALHGHRQADHGIELVHRPHRLDPRVIFRNAFRPEEAGLTRVASTRVQLRHQLTRAATASGGLGKRSGCTMCARISSPSTSRGPGRLKWLEPSTIHVRSAPAPGPPPPQRVPAPPDPPFPLPSRTHPPGLHTPPPAPAPTTPRRSP